MLEKVIENWTSRLDYIRASRSSPMPEIIFKMTHHQHHDPKLRDPSFSAFRKRPALVFFRSFFLPSFGFCRPFKTSGTVHPPLTLSHWWAQMSRSLILNSLEPIGAESANRPLPWFLHKPAGVRHMLRIPLSPFYRL
ncbi:hypothetical protein TNCV_1474571 [Trichonephila clavipes]|nr:hypothetical protein TNCV_1474571 [Trichonephila clavipes]